MRWASYVAALWLAGCQRNETISIFPDAARDDLVIAVVVNEAGETDVRWLHASDPSPRITGDGSDRLYFFLIRDGDLTRRDGFAIYEAGKRPEGYGACGRCLASSLTAPQEIHAGDECPIPAFAEYSGELDARASLEQRLRIGFDGACECQPFREDPEGALPSFELDSASDEAWPYEAAAATPNGTVALFSEHRALLIRPDDERILREEAELPFRGRLLAAAASERDTFFVVGFEGEERKVYVLDGELAPLATLELQLVPSGVFAFREGPVLITGEQPGSGAQAVLCPPQPPFSCRTLLAPGASVELGRTLLDATRMQDGTVVISAETGFALLDHLPVGDEPIQVRLMKQPTSEFGYVLSVGRAGRHAIACVQTEVATIIAAPMDGSLITSGETPPFTVLGTGTLCRPFSAVPGQDDAVRMVFGTGETMVVADGGEAAVVMESATSHRPQGATLNVTAMSTSEPGATLAWIGVDARNTIWVREGANHRRVYGSFLPPPSPIFDLIATNDRVIALHANGAADVLFEADRTQILIEGIPGNFAHVAYDSERGGLLASGTDGARAYLGRVPLQGGPITPIDFAIDGVTDFRAVKEMAPGVFLLVTADRIFVMRDDRIEEVSPSWDDLTTAALEGEVDGCYRDASARDGRAYVVGCGGLLLEVDASPPRARRIGALRASQTLYADAQPEPSFSAVVAVCSDDAVFAAPGQIDTEYERGRTWHLTPLEVGDECADAVGGRCLRDADRVQQIGRYSSGTPLGLAGDAEVLLAVLVAGAHGGASIQRVGGRGRYRFPEALDHVVRAPWGEFVLASTAFSHILRGRLSR